MHRSLAGTLNAMADRIIGFRNDAPAGTPSRKRRRMCAAALSASIVIAGTAGVAASSPASWHGCAAGAGGAMNVSVHQISCGYASRITEAGLYPDARRTRTGGFTCERHRDARNRWAYRCLRAQGRQGLSFDTY